MKRKIISVLVIILLAFNSISFIAEANSGRGNSGNAPGKNKETTTEVVQQPVAESEVPEEQKEANESIQPTEEINTTTHVVQSGDTLWRLSLQYQTTVENIKQLNNLTSDVLFVGQVLVVPALPPSEPQPKEEQEPIVVEPIQEVKRELMNLAYYTKYWHTDMNSYNNLTSYHSYLNSIAVTAYDVTAKGTIEGFDAPEAVDFSKANSVTPYVTIQNKFDPAMTNIILSNPSLRATTIQNMLELVRVKGYEGINLNFENMYASDRANFNQFVKELVEVFHAHDYPVIVSVPAKTADFPTWAWSGTFEYRTIGELADYVQIMTYDQHGSWGEPGPVAGLNWVENVLRYATNEIPADKILIGLPAYAYDWNLDQPSRNRAITWKQVKTLLNTTGASVKWDNAAQSPFFQYTDGNGERHTVWFENESSITLKTELVHKYQLGGVSTWRMGQEDESFWNAVQQGLQR
ncbi:glycosyl hydrolase family 18 protein [Halalkalibacter akibai]|uniref:Uncharacterized protein n=1 Tax=Halalkalibacter akibai (strain ATCC 43226 / DSM 21942 / CIP 109018 / JCM 9157 / 1139) TaxID=1236973 RepID=W4R1N1_HALA3|nr:glycosyl hydrolase family 18 protein [Halalkalibacter akibai]GAE37434.1 hypothetical protein JCM9157_4734 [Halalkalibacter akibai JCM 9157]